MSDKNCDTVSGAIDYSFLFDELKNLSGVELVAVEKYVRQTRIEKQLGEEDFGDKKFNVERKELITALFSQVWEKVDKYEKRYFGNRKFSPIDLLPKVFQKALQYNYFWIACTGDYHMCKKCQDFFGQQRIHLYFYVITVFHRGKITT